MKKKIIVRGPALSQTGYGEQCRFALRALKSREDLFDVYLINIPWGGSNWIFEQSEERDWIDELIIKTMPLLEQQKMNPAMPLFDVSLQVTIPNELQKMAPENVLFTAGMETDRIAAAWAGKCHEIADKILVVSEHAKSGFKQPVKAQLPSGEEIDFVLEKPIETVHYPVKNIDTTDLNLELETKFNFLTLAQWGPRKNLTNTIAWFCEEFKNDEDVGLIVKTYAKGNSKIDKNYVTGQLKRTLENFPDMKCKVYLLHGYMSEQDIHSLYCDSNIHALVNLGHGEGFGLPLFEAAYCGLPVITHDFGGQKDFLYAPKKNKKGVEKMRPHFSKIPYDLRPVQKHVLWQGVIEPNMNWAYPSQPASKAVMRECYKNYGLVKSTAKKLQKWIKEEFEESKKYDAFVQAFFGEELEAEQEIEDLFNQLQL